MGGMPRSSVYRRALYLFRPFAAPTLIGILISFLGIAFNLLKPWPFKIIVDNILVRQGAAGPAGGLLDGFSAGTAVLLLCGALVVVHLLAGLSSSIASFVFIRTGLQVLLELRTRLYAALQALSLKFHEFTGDNRFKFSGCLRLPIDPDALQQGLHGHLRFGNYAREHVCHHADPGLAAHIALNGDCPIRRMGNSPLRRARPPRFLKLFRNARARS